MLQCSIATWTPVQSVDTLTNAAFTVTMPAWRHVCMLQSTHAHWARKMIRQRCHLSTAKYSSHLAIELPQNVLCSSLLQQRSVLFKRKTISSSSSRNEYYLGGIIALLLQDHRTMLIKSVCCSQYMVTDQHWATGTQIKHSTLSVRIRERWLEQNALQFLAEDGKRRCVPNVLR